MFIKELSMKQDFFMAKENLSNQQEPMKESFFKEKNMDKVPISLTMVFAIKDNITITSGRAPADLLTQRLRKQLTKDTFNRDYLTAKVIPTTHKARNLKADGRWV